MIKFIDANVFVRRWEDPACKRFLDAVNQDRFCTSVLALSEAHHKLERLGVKHVFEYVRDIMGLITVYNVLQDDLFSAMKNPLNMPINDKLHLAVMKRNFVDTIVSYDKDFDKDKTITREEP